MFSVTPSKTGILTVMVGYEVDGVTPTCSNLFAADCWALQLYARTTCATASTEVACEAGTITNSFLPETLTIDVTAGSTYFIFVDGYDSGNYSYGPFNLILNLQ